MTTAQVVETSVTVNNNSPIQDYVHPDDQTQPTFEMCIVFTDMAREAGTAALKDAGILYQDVEAVIASYCYGEPTSGKVQVAVSFR